jgi:hypothetical protein
MVAVCECVWVGELWRDGMCCFCTVKKRLERLRGEAFVINDVGVNGGGSSEVTEERWWVGVELRVF